MDLAERSLAHAALGDDSRLRLVDLLVSGDHTVGELAVATEMPGNLLAHHLDVLEAAGLVERRPSEGDRRRRYVILRRAVLDGLLPDRGSIDGAVVFVCSHNSARSQYAAAYWMAATGRGGAASAGNDPSETINSLAVRVAGERGLDLSSALPQGYDSIDGVPEHLISVCDRAREGSLPQAGRYSHWSIPDPVRVGHIDAFRSAFTEIERRIDDLAG
jgi:protein-tyrosine-phosphatase